MNKSESITHLATALAKAQAEMPVAVLDATNPFLKNKYADLGAIIETSKTILAKNGLSVSQLPEIDNGLVRITTILMHSSGEWIESISSLSLEDQKGLTKAQAAGSLITYLRRYSLASVLGLYADADDDGNDHKDKKEPITYQKLADAIQEEGGVPATNDVKPEYTGKTAKLHQHNYPIGWTGKLIQTFVTTNKLNVPHLDGILQKLNLSFDTDVDTVISAVNDYAKENKGE